MPTITLRLELHKPTQAKQDMYQRMTEINTAFANWLLVHRRKGVIHMAKCDKCKKNTANIESERKGKLCNDCAKKNK